MPVIEEALFRGFLVIDKRGRAAPWGGIVGSSVVFGLLDSFLWEWKGSDFTVHFGAKPWFSTTATFAMSLWAYTLHFLGLNPQRSLLPCFVRLATKNAGVLAIKCVQEFVGGR